MKDWKAECEVMKGQMKELERDRNYWRSVVETRADQDREITDKFKALLIKVLER